MPDQTSHADLLALTTEIVSSHVSNNTVSQHDMASLIEQVFRTLSYFDGVNFAPRVRAHTLFSVGMMDTICPPSTVYAAYNRLKTKKLIKIYDYNNHEGGAQFQFLERMRFAARHL